MAAFVHVTFRAEADGDRKRFFSFIAEYRVGNLLESNQLQGYVYKFLIMINEDVSVLRNQLQAWGVDVLQITDEHDTPIWTHTRYRPPFKEGDLTVKQIKRLQKYESVHTGK